MAVVGRAEGRARQRGRLLFEVESVIDVRKLITPATRPVVTVSGPQPEDRASSARSRKPRRHHHAAHEPNGSNTVTSAVGARGADRVSARSRRRAYRGSPQHMARSTAEVMQQFAFMQRPMSRASSRSSVTVVAGGRSASQGSTGSEAHRAAVAPRSRRH